MPVNDRPVVHLADQGMSATACRGVFVSLFVGEYLYLIEAPTFLDAVKR